MPSWSARTSAWWSRRRGSSCAAAGILGTSILWFERDDEGDPLPAERWRELCLASVTTHDLPPSAGFLAGDHVRLREELGLLTRPVAEEQAADDAERESWLAEVRSRGLLPEDADVEQTVRALHAYLALTPSRLRCVALTDAVGDRRTQNQPGTVDEHPNWRVPLSGPDGCAAAAGGRGHVVAGGRPGGDGAGPRRAVGGGPGRTSAPWSSARPAARGRAASAQRPASSRGRDGWRGGGWSVVVEQRAQRRGEVAARCGVRVPGAAPAAVEPSPPLVRWSSVSRPARVPVVEPVETTTSSAPETSEILVHMPVRTPFPGPDCRWSMPEFPV